MNAGSVTSSTSGGKADRVGRGLMIFGTVLIAVALALTAWAFVAGYPWTAVPNVITFTCGVGNILLGLDARHSHRRYSGKGRADGAGWGGGT